MGKPKTETVRIVVRLRCFYCDERVLVPFRKLRTQESAHTELQRHGWIFGVERMEDGAVAFDPLCPEHAREIVLAMLAKGGGRVDPEADRRLRELFPDLFEGQAN